MVIGYIHEIFVLDQTIKYVFIITTNIILLRFAIGTHM